MPWLILHVGVEERTNVEDVKLSARFGVTVMRKGLIRGCIGEPTIRAVRQVITAKSVSFFPLGMRPLVCRARELDGICKGHGG